MYKITSPNNPLIKEIKSLGRKKDRWSKRQYIIEGTKPVKEALLEQIEIINIFYSQKLFEREEGRNLFKQLKDKNNIIELEDLLFQSLSNMENSQGVFIVANMEDFKLEDMTRTKPYIYLDEIDRKSVV